MALFVELCGLEMVCAVAEIGAGILPVPVKEQLIELVRQIIVMSCVPPGTRDRVVLVRTAQQCGGTVEQLADDASRQGFEIDREEIDQIV